MWAPVVAAGLLRRTFRGLRAVYAFSASAACPASCPMVVTGPGTCRGTPPPLGSCFPARWRTVSRPASPACRLSPSRRTRGPSRASRSSAAPRGNRHAPGECVFSDSTTPLIDLPRLRHAAECRCTSPRPSGALARNELENAPEKPTLPLSQHQPGAPLARRRGAIETAPHARLKSSDMPLHARLWNADRLELLVPERRVHGKVQSGRDYARSAATPSRRGDVRRLADARVASRQHLRDHSGRHRSRLHHC